MDVSAGFQAMHVIFGVSALFVAGAVTIGRDIRALGLVLCLGMALVVFQIANGWFIWGHSFMDIIAMRTSRSVSLGYGLIAGSLMGGIVNAFRVAFQRSHNRKQPRK